MEIIKENLTSSIMFFMTLIMSPMMFAIINRCKAWFAGRKGPPLLQPYYDLIKLMRKGVVYSTTATWVVRVAPVIILSTTIMAAILTPFASKAIWAFKGDFLVWIALFAVARFFLMLAALDTGSAFEGMGASREAWYATLIEPGLFLFMTAAVCITKSYSLSDMFIKIAGSSWDRYLTVQIFLIIAIFLIILAENCRIPVDDPNTHLELTMIHEVMVLDYSGPDLAIIHYASALKLWVMSALFVKLVLPSFAVAGWVNNILFVMTMIIIAVIIGAVESVMARLRLIRVPQLLVAAAALAALSLILVLR